MSTEELRKPQSSYRLVRVITVHTRNANLGFWSGNLFLIAPFPDLCLSVPV